MFNLFYNSKIVLIAITFLFLKSLYSYILIFKYLIKNFHDVYILCIGNAYNFIHKSILNIHNHAKINSIHSYKNQNSHHTISSLRMQSTTNDIEIPQALQKYVIHNQ